MKYRKGHISDIALEKIRRLRNGEKLKCPKCDNGYISAIGKSESIEKFKCSDCTIHFGVKNDQIIYPSEDILFL